MQFHSIFSIFVIDFNTCLHLFNQFAILCLLELHVKVEGAADARVGHHRGEDLRAVDLLALIGAHCYKVILLRMI